MVTASGTIVWPGPHDTLYALSSTGALLWTERLDGFPLSPADRGDGRLYIMDQGGTVSALDLEDDGRHRVAWKLRVGTGSYGSPVVAPDGTVVVTTTRSVLAVRDLGTRGELAWSWRSPADIEVSAGVAPDGTVVVGPNDQWTYGISPGGHLRWKWFKGDWSYSSAVVTGNSVAWFGDHQGYLDVLDAATGRLIRRDATLSKSEPHPGGVGVWTAPAVDSRDDVYFGTVVGHVYGFDAGGGRLFDVLTGGQVDSYPAIDASGTLYVGSTDGYLYAIGS